MTETKKINLRQRIQILFSGKIKDKPKDKPFDEILNQYVKNNFNENSSTHTLIIPPVEKSLPRNILIEMICEIVFNELGFKLRAIDENTIYFYGKKKEKIEFNKISYDEKIEVIEKKVIKNEIKAGKE
jgi:hypothetical protein